MYRRMLIIMLASFSVCFAQTVYEKTALTIKVPLNKQFQIIFDNMKTIRTTYSDADPDKQLIWEKRSYYLVLLGKKEGKYTMFIEFDEGYQILMLEVTQQISNVAGVVIRSDGRIEQVTDSPSQQGRKNPQSGGVGGATSDNQALDAIRRDIEKRLNAIENTILGQTPKTAADIVNKMVDASSTEEIAKNNKLSVAPEERISRYTDETGVEYSVIGAFDTRIISALVAAYNFDASGYIPVYYKDNDALKPLAFGVPVRKLFGLKGTVYSVDVLVIENKVIGGGDVWLGDDFIMQYLYLVYKKPVAYLLDSYRIPGQMFGKPKATLLYVCFMP